MALWELARRLACQVYGGEKKNRRGSSRARGKFKSRSQQSRRRGGAAPENLRNYLLEERTRSMLRRGGIENCFPENQVEASSTDCFREQGEGAPVSPHL